MSEANTRKAKAAEKALLIAELKSALANARAEAERTAEAFLAKYPRLPGEHHEFVAQRYSCVSRALSSAKL
jgi:hypothetical protein